MERATPEALPSYEEDRPPRAYFPPPPKPTVGDAVRRYWLLVLLAILAVGAGGAHYANTRKPVYKATASVSVGLVDLNTQSVPGFAVGGEVVAGGFSRSVQTDDVIVPAARQLHMTPAHVRAHVTSSTVPDSPIFTITARGGSAAEAVGMANAVSRSMIAYGRSRSSSRASFARLLARYRDAVRDRNRARSRLEALRSRATRSRSTATQTSTSRTSTASSTKRRAPSSKALAKARADLAAQQLRVDGLVDQYRSRASQPGNAPVLQPVAYARDASNDRKSKMQLYGALGALAGLCVGTALAVMLMGLRHRRRSAF